MLSAATPDGSETYLSQYNDTTDHVGWFIATYPLVAVGLTFYLSDLSMDPSFFMRLISSAVLLLLWLFDRALGQEVRMGLAWIQVFPPVYLHRRHKHRTSRVMLVVSAVATLTYVASSIALPFLFKGGGCNIPFEQLDAAFKHESLLGAAGVELGKQDSYYNVRNTLRNTTCVGFMNTAHGDRYELQYRLRKNLYGPSDIVNLRVQKILQ